VAKPVTLHHKEIKSVIANSAGLPDKKQVADVLVSVLWALLLGADMNMTVLLLNNNLDKTQTKHRIIFF